MNKFAEYKLWDSMKSRCYNPKSPSYKNYGAKGITVCERWRTSYDNFIEDMGHRHTPKHQLDRIDNNKGYEPGNCKWSTPKENNLNRTNNIIVMFNGSKRVLSDVAEELGISVNTIYARYYRGDRDEKLFRSISS